ncbi:hypothetical protein AHF37_03943 [Paragonimus kellicotti]|nr:hypothetical protein AHF37_03943 [Paragonimus kellicotti]
MSTYYAINPPTIGLTITSSSHWTYCTTCFHVVAFFMCCFCFTIDGLFTTICLKLFPVFFLFAFMRYLLLLHGPSNRSGVIPEDVRTILCCSASLQTIHTVVDHHCSGRTIIDRIVIVFCNMHSAVGPQL